MDTPAKIMNIFIEQLKETHMACREMESAYDQVMTEVPQDDDRVYEID
jgi:hypothetical protein